MSVSTSTSYLIQNLRAARMRLDIGLVPLLNDGVGSLIPHHVTTRKIMID